MISGAYLLSEQNLNNKKENSFTKEKGSLLVLFGFSFFIRKHYKSLANVI